MNVSVMVSAVPSLALNDRQALRLDAIWQDRKVRCPSHKVRWNEDGQGYSEGEGMHWTKGKLTFPARLPLRKLRRKLGLPY